ncbi:MULTISPECIES: 4Fe-4S dicluster domain-containing protein [Psychrilyobacter]|uniref:4Fe-4S dicluster domain-containing protein n=1 Tax=Psychrilyobacter piezotolerans TaxID=2293438 RepID=A0ABX9KFU4_9FUSO|nr:MULTISPECIES: 4Fe-4S dicluster domain-containing protein [Psychrilyobacter]MCS5422145.1 4Fe-4S dicluster domain-containing protein [Psychrilyobacter sp. S5]NDI78451.1 4Fe-4S dicluster domain-containing protein [Psychrilyobacter piezotolerans]RDE60635.1 4Fe-4S dicluster domain-containing protein [Psychrilyobacter sp. S5]REI40562.1 4Fe-4S dicluster domain-containing protein [Psychrilyobacter piezotolerans]
MSEKKMIDVYIFGKKYTVPSSLTIMDSMEYAGYQLTKGCGCRSGFCGACSTIYRVKGDKELKIALACQTKVEDGMYFTQLPFFPGEKPLYNINEFEPAMDTMAKFYPEIYKCIGCNSCTNGCPQDLNVMQYIAHAQRGEFEKCAHESFDCVSCGICASRCPAGITHYNAALLARRLTGKYIVPETEHLKNKVQEIAAGEHDQSIEEIMGKNIEELKELYNTRDITK